MGGFSYRTAKLRERRSWWYSLGNVPWSSNVLLWANTQKDMRFPGQLSRNSSHATQRWLKVLSYLLGSPLKGSSMFTASTLAQNSSYGRRAGSMITNTVQNLVQKKFVFGFSQYCFQRKRNSAKSMYPFGGGLLLCALNCLKQ